MFVDKEKGELYKKTTRGRGRREERGWFGLIYLSDDGVGVDSKLESM